MHINIIGLYKPTLLRELIRRALRCLMKRNPEQGPEYEALLSALERSQGPFPLSGPLQYLPEGHRPEVDVTGNTFDTRHYDSMFGEGAGEKVVTGLRRQEQRWHEAISSRKLRESTSGATSAEGPGGSGGGEGPSTSVQGAGCPGDGSPPAQRQRPDGSGESGEGPSTSVQGAGCSGGSGAEGHQR